VLFVFLFLTSLATHGIRQLRVGMSSGRTRSTTHNLGHSVHPIHIPINDPHSGQEEYDRLRPLSYNKAHVILVAFAINAPDSLDNVPTKVATPQSLFNPYLGQWFDEVSQYCPGTPVIIVGLKSDLREDPEAQEDMRRKSLRFIDSSMANTPSLCVGLIYSGRTSCETNRCKEVFRMFGIDGL
jgi:Ras family